MFVTYTLSQYRYLTGLIVMGLVKTNKIRSGYTNPLNYWVKSAMS